MADFRIRVVVDPRPAIAGADKVERRMNRLGRTATALRTQFATILGAGGALIAFAQGTRVLANFEQTMSTVKAISGATDAQFAELTETAKNLGATTRFTAAQAGEGLLFLSRAGFDVNESLEAVGGTLNLAQAGALDLGQAADIASNVLQGFRLETDQTTRVVDVLAFTANNANTNVAQLGQALSFAAPVAAGLGVTVEQTSAAIAALSNAGIQSTRAGTGLVRVMAELESPTTKSQEIFKLLGVTLDDVRISEVGLEGALKALAEAGITTGQALEIFGKRGGPAFEVLASSIPTVVGMSQELLNVEGTAARVAAIMDDNLNGALLRVKSAAEAVVLAFGTLGGSGFLRGFFEGLAASLRAFARNLDTVIKLVKTLVVVLSVAFAQRAVGLAVTGFNAITAAVGRLTAAIALNPIGALALAIVAVVTLLFQFRDSIKLSSDGMATLGDLFAAAANIIKETFGGAIVFVQDALALLGGIFGDVFGNIDISIAGVLRGLARLADFIVNVFTLKLQIVSTFVEKLPAALKDAFTTALNFVLTATESGINKIVRALNAIPGVDIELVDIPTLENKAAGAGAALGKALLKDFSDTLEAGAATSFVNRLLTDAETRAQERLAGPAPVTRPTVTTGGAAATEDAAGIRAELQAVLDSLEEQRRLLSLTNAERAVSKAAGEKARTTANRASSHPDRRPRRPRTPQPG